MYIKRISASRGCYLSFLDRVFLPKILRLKPGSVVNMIACRSLKPICVFSQEQAEKYFPKVNIHHNSILADEIRYKASKIGHVDITY